MKYIIISLLVLIAIYVFKTRAAGDSTQTKEVKVLINPTIIDVRSQEEFNSGHIDGAILIPHDKIKELISSKVKDKKTNIVVYCRSGHRAGLAKKYLDELGYENVENYGSMAQAKKLLNK